MGLAVKREPVTKSLANSYAFSLRNLENIMLKDYHRRKNMRDQSCQTSHVGEDRLSVSLNDWLVKDLGTDFGANSQKTGSQTNILSRHQRLQNSLTGLDKLKYDNLTKDLKAIQ